MNYKILYTLVFVLRIKLEISNYSYGGFCKMSSPVTVNQYTLELGEHLTQATLFSINNTLFIWLLELSPFKKLLVGS